MEYFKNKVIWITGASSGIGEALAKALAQVDCKIILSARNTAKLETLVQQLGSNSAEVKLLALDLEQHDTLHDTVQTALSLWGQVDILINNAGLSQRSLALETSPAVDKKLMDVNYHGTVILTKALLPSWVARKAGHVAVVSSLAGKFGSPMRSGYAASKHALHGFFDSLRAELWADNIYVTMLCPGFVHTNISINAVTADGKAQGSMDEATRNGLSPEACAARMLQAIAKKKQEVYIGKSELRGIYVKRFFPALFAKLIRKAKVV